MAHNVTAPGLVHIVKEVFQERAHRLMTEKTLGILFTVEALVNNLFVCCIVRGRNTP